MSASASTTPTPADFVWYELHNSDTASAQAFYRPVLGWNTEELRGGPSPYVRATVGNAPVAGMLQKPESAFLNGTKAAWIGYIGVNDIQTSLARLRQAGGSVHREVEDIPGIGQFAAVSDPQGAVFVLFQPAPLQNERERPQPGMPGTAAWHDLAAAEWESDFAFYSDLFGWSKSEAIPMGPNGVYQIFASGSRPIRGMMTRMNPQQKPGWLFYFNVTEIHDAVERVKQHGGTLVHGPSEVPGGQQIAHCLDPQGAIFGIVAPPAQP